MAFHLPKDDQNKVFLSFKNTVAFEKGPVTAFHESTRGENFLNERCEKGGKAVKISSFETAKSIEEFAICTTAAGFQSQLESFFSKERSVSNSSPSPSSHSSDVALSSEMTGLTTTSGTPNSASVSKTNQQPVTPNIGSNVGNSAAVGNNTETLCTSRQRRNRKRSRLPEPDVTEIIQSLPWEDVLSPLQRRFEECKVGKSNAWYSLSFIKSQKLFCNRDSFMFGNLK